MMMNKLCLVDTMNHLIKGVVTTAWATLNFDEILLILNAAGPTCLQTLSGLTTLDHSLPRKYNPMSDGEKKQQRNAALHEDIDYEDIGMPFKPDGSWSA